MCLLVGPASSAVELTELIDWQLAASSRSSSGSGRSTDGRSNSAWLTTQSGRYRLLSPAESYSDVFVKTLQKVGAAGRAPEDAATADGWLHAVGVDLAAMGALSARCTHRLILRRDSVLLATQAAHES